jgi:hypothetical protein
VEFFEPPLGDVRRQWLVCPTDIDAKGLPEERGRVLRLVVPELPLLSDQGNGDEVLRIGREERLFVSDNVLDH